VRGYFIKKLLLIKTMVDILFWFILVSIFIFGLIVGSFLNCLVWRSYAGESAMHGRSYCPKCRNQLAWFDLVPVFSFLALAGRCRYCKKPISWQYPAVELACGLLFCAAAFAFAPMVFAGYFSIFPILELLAYRLVLAALIAIFAADLRWYIIPDGALIAGLAGASVLRGLQLWESGLVFHQFDAGIIIGPLLAAIFAAGFFLAIFLLSRGKWMGFGDVKFAVLMGFLLGIPEVLVALFLANFFGAIMGLGLIAAGKKKMSSLIPFGPFLVAGTLAALFFFRRIIDWYFSIGV